MTPEEISSLLQATAGLKLAADDLADSIKLSTEETKQNINKAIWIGALVVIIMLFIGIVAIKQEIHTGENKKLIRLSVFYRYTPISEPPKLYKNVLIS